ncbi:beta-1,4-galactosyltransferase 4-like [Dreissena polymorpha]|uniref:beta-1,4-galactosyltransferase 4-like n=1 Tax=Dreissena polymorpha TaxID=45954 RepID=UPI002263E663|nr:beta-1,4-galactosyltransferase 4-like [Dreissena polymorpha]
MVALVVPYRNRPSQLPIFISRIFPFLQRQRVDFRMFLIEQDPSGAFNRAKLFNVGYNESSKYGDFDCFIFHDVDLIPENDTTTSYCMQIPYSSFVGGVLAMNETVFQLVNGFSNLYLGWGGEDDDMSVRILENGFKVRRPPLGAGRYKMIRHQKEIPSQMRFKLLEEAKTRMATEGLNSLQYNLVFSNTTKNYVHIMANLYTI